MNDHLRSRIQRRLESLSDDRGYQILDYIEFLESKYAEKSAPAAGAANPFTKFTEAVEDRLRAGEGLGDRDCPDGRPDEPRHECSEQRPGRYQDHGTELAAVPNRCAGRGSATLRPVRTSHEPG